MVRALSHALLSAALCPDAGPSNEPTQTGSLASRFSPKGGAPTALCHKGGALTGVCPKGWCGHQGKGGAPATAKGGASTKRDLTSEIKEGRKAALLLISDLHFWRF